MSFAVLADLPLGIYRGAVGGGDLDPYPTPARLHAALVCAAAAGPRAIVEDGALRPCSADAAALAWLEANPPDGVLIPLTRRVAMAVTAYRQEGVLKKEGKASGPSPKVRGKGLVGFVAVSGRFAWTWDEMPPRAVAEALDALVGDVSHLGSGETPARLRLGEAEPTHRRDTDASLLTARAGDLDLEVPAADRTAVLVTAYRAGLAMPTVRQDSWSSSEEPSSMPPVHAGKRTERYGAPQQPLVDVPWPEVHVLRLGGRGFAPDELVSVAVSAHRALVKVIGFGAPPLLTGAYLDGVARPANRLALQVVRPDLARVLGYDGSLLLAFVPSGADPTETETVVRALQQLRRLAAAERPVRYLDARSGIDLWPAGSGAWTTVPAMVSDVRPPTNDWTLEQSVRLALGLVLRERFHNSLRGREHLLTMTDAVHEAGCEVRSAVKLTSGRLTGYVHKVAPGTVVQPIRAELVTDLVPPRAAVAVGQSRHLGGGLLVPSEVARP